MNKLWVRLAITFTGMVLIAVLIVVLTGFIIELFVSDERDRFTSWHLTQPNGLAENLTGFYQANGSWDGVAPMLAGAQSTYFRADSAFVLADSNQQIIYHTQPENINQPLREIRPKVVLPLEVGRETIGYLGVVRLPREQRDDHGPPPLARELIQGLLVIAVIGGVGGIGFGVVMSRSLSAPLNDLAAAARDIGARNLSRRVEEKGSDEMRAVTHAFNEMAADLEQAEQLRRNMLADVAHELRTPLSVLQGNLRAILDEVYPLNQEEVARLYEHTRFLSRLVNDLHELAQAEAHQLPLHRQETDLSTLVENVSDTFRPGAEAQSITLRTQASPDLPLVNVDPGRITQVLQNLLANALHHTPAEGRITIGTEAAGEVIRVVISDTGDGIPPEHLPHIFDRFYRADPARARDKGGAGLGLAIARAIVETHGGKIGAASSGVSGQGTTFTLTFPPGK